MVYLDWFDADGNSAVDLHITLYVPASVYSERYYLSGSMVI
ncbi:hypothetical protein [Dyadobacter aurulentus]|nr:hypothetical protein [Dyadobacter sp. UC 10]